jgi:RimJ/RimL family protein N-acetyltransferase
MLGHWAVFGYGVFALEDLFSGELVGRAGISNDSKQPDAALVVALARALGRGFASEAVRAVVDWGFSHLGLTRLPSYIPPGNATSLKFAARLGAVREGFAERGGQIYEAWIFNA